MKRIILVGYMGSGKTTIGRQLARNLGLEFYDLDWYIETRYHCTVAQIFAERGEEGFREIAQKFRKVAAVEKSHEERFLRLLNTVEMQQIFEKTEEIMWQCRNCGHLHFGKKAPEQCPVCGYPKSYFQQKPENY